MLEVGESVRQAGERVLAQCQRLQVHQAADFRRQAVQLVSVQVKFHQVGQIFHSHGQLSYLKEKGKEKKFSSERCCYFLSQMVDFIYTFIFTESPLLLFFFLK